MDISDGQFVAAVMNTDISIFKQGWAFERWLNDLLWFYIIA